MNKIFLVLLCFVWYSDTIASRYCVGTTGSWFRKSPYQKIDCTCPCQQYPRSLHGDGHTCLRCDHRQLPSDLGAKIRFVKKA